MSDGDKRKVSTDALETLGTIIGPDEKRDAIHLAVIPMKAQWRVHPGEDVDARGNPHGVDKVGIVDPFLKEPSVAVGEWFWLVIYPRKINSLRHVWSHPAFPDEAPTPDKFTKEYSENYLREICSRWEGPNYETLLVLAEFGQASASDGDPDYNDYGSYRIDGEYLYSYGQDASGEIPAEIWDHVENIIGKKAKGRPTYFSCSC